MYLVIRVLVHVDTRKTAGKNMPPWCYWLSNTPQGTLKLSSIDALQILDSLTFLDNNYRLFCDETEVIMPVNMLMFWPLTTQYLLRYYMSTQYLWVGLHPSLNSTSILKLNYALVRVSWWQNLSTHRHINTWQNTQIHLCVSSHYHRWLNDHILPLWHKQTHKLKTIPANAAVAERINDITEKYFSVKLPFNCYWTRLSVQC